MRYETADEYARARELQRPHDSRVYSQERRD